VTADYTPEGRMKSKDWASGTTCEETGVAQCGRLGGLPFGFHSAYKSPAHGLLYFRNRWYSAESGQWLTHDPLGEVDSANLYAFNGFDPINHRDPLEHRTGSFTT
jgi:RHS repeat-associated protein